MRAARPIARFAVSGVILAGLLWWLDAGALADRLAGLRPGWALLAVAISGPQVLLLAVRWRLTASRLGAALPLGDAVREYYLAVFLNQVLPGGLLGDASRAWRHGRRGEREAFGPAVRAVILERASGQALMAIVAALSVAALPLAFPSLPAGVLILAAAVGVVTLAGLGRLARGRLGRGPLEVLWGDARRALLAHDVVLAQAALSTLVVATYLAIYVVAARAVGVTTPLATLLPLISPVLMSMLIPATVAGWGVREATAAALWGAVGLTPVDGMAISAAYGLLVLVSSLPGAIVLIASRGRRARPHPGDGGGSEPAAPPTASRSEAGSAPADPTR